jgi:ribonuclease HIII
MVEIYSSKFNTAEESVFKKKLESDGFIFKPINYAFWQAQGKNVNATLYLSGKIVIQGKETDSFLNKYLKITIEKAVNEQQKIEHIKIPYIGTDESGKGDYFGPLVIAGVLVEESNLKALQELGLRDSKKIADYSIEKLAPKIKETCVSSVIVINPAKYNELYLKFKNLNTLLAWGHARAIENILEKKECPNAVSDKFGNESLIKNALMKKGREINLIQETKAEDKNIAVAAASILARDEFLKRMRRLSMEHGIKFQKGAGDKVKSQTDEFIKKYGFDKLTNIAKLHFKTTPKQ